MSSDPSPTSWLADVTGKLPGAAVTLLVVVGVPLVAGVLLGGPEAISITVCTCVFAVMMCLRAGWARAGLAVPVLAGAVLAGGLLAGGPWWVVLLAGVGVATGLAASRGYGVVLALVGAATASAPALPAAGESGARVAWVAVVALYVVVVTRALGFPRTVSSPPVPLPTAVVAASVLGTVVAVAAVVAQQSGERLAYWLPATVFLLVVPVPGLRWTQAAGTRVLGTGLGVLAGFLVAVPGPPGAVRAAVAVLALLLALSVSRPVWFATATSTLVLVLALDPTGDGIVVGEVRLAATVVAAVLVLVGGAVLAWLLERFGLLDRANQAAA